VERAKDHRFDIGGEFVGDAFDAAFASIHAWGGRKPASTQVMTTATRSSAAGGPRDRARNRVATVQTPRGRWAIAFAASSSPSSTSGGTLGGVSSTKPGGRGGRSVIRMRSAICLRMSEIERLSSNPSRLARVLSSSSESEDNVRPVRSLYEYYI
jgi:hypothetical protein